MLSRPIDTARASYRHLTSRFKQVLFVLFVLVFANTLSQAQKPKLYLQTGHSDEISDLAFSPNDKILASIDTNHKGVKLWEVESGREVRSLPGHEQGTEGFAFIANRTLITCGADNEDGGSIKVWDVTTGSVVRTVTTYKGSLTNLLVSMDGKTAAGVLEKKTIHFWDIATGNLVRTLTVDGKDIDYIASSKDFRIFGGLAGNTLIIWETASGREVKRDSGDYFDISPMGDAVSIFKNKKSIITNLITGREVLTIPEKIGAFSLDPRIMFGLDGSTYAVSVFDLSTGKELRRLALRQTVTMALGKEEGSIVVWSRDTKLLAIGTKSGNVEIFSIETGGAVALLSTHVLQNSLADINRNRNSIAIASRAGLNFWSLPAGVWSFVSIDLRLVTNIAFNPDGKTAAVGFGGKILKLYDLESGRELRTLSEKSGKETDRFDSLTFSDDGQVLLVNDGQQIHVWNTSSARELRTFETLFVAELSPDAKFVLTNERTEPTGTEKPYQKLIMWDLATGKVVRTFTNQSDDVTSGRFTPNSKLLLINQSKSWGLYDVTSGNKLWTLSGDELADIAFSKNSKLLAIQTNNKSLRIIDVATGRELSSLGCDICESFLFHNQLKSMTFSADGKIFAASTGEVVRKSLLSPDRASFKNTIQFWDVQSGRSLRALPLDSEAVEISFSPDGKTLFSQNADNTLTLYDVATGRELVKLVSQTIRSLADYEAGKIGWAVIAPDGRFDASSDAMPLLHFLKGEQVLTLDALFEKYYTPGLLRQVLERQAEAPSPSIADFDTLKLAPQVKIISPPGNTTEAESLQLSVEATDQGGGVDEVRLYQNGKLVTNVVRQLARTPINTRQTFDVALMPGINEFRATAFNNDRTEAFSEEFKVERRAPQPTANLYVLAVGLNEYQNPKYNLNYGRTDAEAFAAAIAERGKGIFKTVNVELLTDGKATRSSIEAALQHITDVAKKQDVFIFYYAGHGAMTDRNEKAASEFYLVPYDVTQIYGGDNSLAARGISARSILELSMRISALKQLVLLDACQSGGAVEQFAALLRGSAEEKAIAQLARSAGVTVLAAAGQDQFAVEYKDLNHGAFTYALLQGLNGEADGGSKPDGKITVAELKAFIEDRVPELTQKYRGKPQYATSWARGQDFPLGVK
jgi:WD40 repeat protein